MSVLGDSKRVRAVEAGGAGGPWLQQILADHLSQTQPEREDYAHLITSPSDFQTFLRPCNRTLLFLIIIGNVKNILFFFDTF